MPLFNIKLNEIKRLQKLIGGGSIYVDFPNLRGAYR